MSGSEPGSRTGSRFGPYQLRRLLGRGGMGEVYEAEDTRKNRIVALKLISQQFSGDPVFRARMQREAQEAGRLTEPHVVPIHDYGEIDGKLYLDMRLIDGVSLREMLKRGGALAPARAVAIISQIADALDAAHATGVTHRDVKPENILITRNDFAYLVDFGIARAAKDPGLTQTGLAMGTYGYMAPERFTGNPVTYRADIYSLACVLAECLTGSPPFSAESIERAVAAHLTEPAPRPSQLVPGRVPEAFDQVIALGMAKDPDNRYRSAGDLARSANDALTVPEQDQAATILEHSEDETRSGRAVDSRRVGAANWTQPARTPTPPAGAGNWRQPWPSSSGAPAGPPPVYGQPPRLPEPDFAAGPVRPSPRRKVAVLIGVGALLVVAAIVTGFLLMRPSRPASASRQSVLPFTGIDFRLSPGGIALDSAGNVYVTNQGIYGRVVELAAGSTTTTVWPFSGLYQPQGLAVDTAGAAYVADFNNRVVKLAPGSNNQTVLPFTGLNYPEGVAVDSNGSVYVADRGNDRVLKLTAGSNTQVELPFSGLNNPDGVAVDTAGSVYVTDTDNNRVLKLPPGSNSATELPFAGVTVPWGIAVDTVGTVYVTEHDKNQVVKLPAGSNIPIVLPFTDLNTPLAVAVDPAKNVYVADRGNDRVVKQAAG